MHSNDEDEDLFIPASTSSLASLFKTAMNGVEEKDKSLIYTAPKQPKSGSQESQSKPNSQSEIIYSNVVDLFKLVDKKPISQGKCGMAIIGNEAVKSYEIIMYKSKQEIIMRTRFRDDFAFVIQSNNFVYINDEHKQEWSVHFESADVIDYFAQIISTQSGKVLVATNKSEKETSMVKDKTSDSDSTNNSSNKTRASILSRMAKMGQSILPSNLPKQVSTESESEEKEKVTSRRVPKKRVSKHVSGKTESLVDPIKNSNSEQNINPQANLLSEFVLVNNQMTPFATVNQGVVYPFSNIAPQVMFAQSQAPPISDSLNVFLAENRTHNCEMRMNMMQLSLKLDKVLNELAKDKNITLHTSNGPEFHLNESLKNLNNGVIDNYQEQLNYQEIINNNEQIINNLRQQNDEQQETILQYEGKIQDLQQNFNCEGFQKTITEQKQIIQNLEQTIEEQKANLDKLTQQLEDKNNEIIHELNDKIRNLEIQLRNKKSKASLFSKKLKQSMNILYHQIMENFNNDTSFPANQIKEILSQQLINATFSLIQEFQNDFKNFEPNTSSTSPH